MNRRSSVMVRRGWARTPWTQGLRPSSAVLLPKGTLGPSGTEEGENGSLRSFLCGAREQINALSGSRKLLKAIE
jgi:hypothetical protein